MKVRIMRAWAVAMAIALTATGASASVPTDGATIADDPGVRVVNNHEYRIQVVLVDKAGRHHSLGQIAPDRAREFDLEAYTDAGLPVQVKIVVDEPVWSPGATGRAVRSGSLYISDHTDVRIWVASDLAETEVEVHNWR